MVAGFFRPRPRCTGARDVAVDTAVTGARDRREKGRHVPDNGRGTEASGRVEFVHRSWPADPAQLSVIRRELAGWLAPLALTDDEVAGVVLAVDEAAANAVRHAYGPGGSGVVELTMWTEPGTLCVEVVDHGSWVPPATDTAPDGLADGGRGIPLMSSMAEAVLIHHDGRGSRVLLRHPVADGESGVESGDRNAVGAAEY
jgi:anti-sigma regulatory factor (Ser/Thr protein kinase)